METRTLTQVKIFTLLLNPMLANFEKVNLVALSYSKEDLMAWYESLKVEPYKDDRWYKVFKQGSPLEWYNPIEHGEHCGVNEEWSTIEGIHNFIQRARASFGFATVPEVINSPELNP